MSLNKCITDSTGAGHWRRDYADIILNELKYRGPMNLNSILEVMSNLPAGERDVFTVNGKFLNITELSVEDLLSSLVEEGTVGVEKGIYSIN